MADDTVQAAATSSPFQTVQADDPTAPHDLVITLHCATESAAYNILMDFASKMHLQCSGMDDLPEDRSLPLAGTVIGLLTRGVTPQLLGHGVVNQL